MEIVMRNINDLIPYERNQKKHDEKQILNVANSIKRFGWQQPIVIDEKDVVVIGHCRLLAAKRLKLDEVPVTVASGLTEDEIRELRIADNKTNESPWDLQALVPDIKELEFDGFDFDFQSQDDSEIEETEQHYTGKADSLYYDIKGEQPTFSELVDMDKYNELIEQINSSALSEQQKQFLRIAACRHYVFDYHNIAQYYAHQSEQMQRLMERSALVIIDYESAIANGYAKLKSEIEQIAEGFKDA